ncbi:hypothetical protein SDC9_117316 [bioreactor metagenome]|uniref:Uncharacterized protein n=1 Tax=bioreactor metagenome TaxID=1076179 RepID=A0A645C099_9ZZZZ
MSNKILQIIKYYQLRQLDKKVRIATKLMLRLEKKVNSTGFTSRDLHNQYF